MTERRWQVCVGNQAARGGTTTYEVRAISENEAKRKARQMAAYDNCLSQRIAWVRPIVDASSPA